MDVIIDMQIACTQVSDLPESKDFTHWAKKTLVGANYQQDAEITVRIVEPAEIQQLNRDYRKQDKTTNILSFPFEAPEGVELNLLGDLVICAEVVEFEAKQQEKQIQQHWAHMVIHGILHLLSYDHINEDDAQQMESLEIELLASLGYADPYQSVKTME